MHFNRVHLVVRLFWDFADCERTDEYSEVQVRFFPQWLDRESFLVHVHFRDLCMLTGHDTSVISVGGKPWSLEDFESRYIFDGMFATVRCPSPIRSIPLRHQVVRAREGWTYQDMLRTWLHPHTPTDDFTLLQLRGILQPFRDAFAGLRPPGNGKLDSLDTVVVDDEGLSHIVDWQDPAENCRPLLLSELLAIATPMQQRQNIAKLHALQETEARPPQCTKECDGGNSNTPGLPVHPNGAQVSIFEALGNTEVAINTPHSLSPKEEKCQCEGEAQLSRVSLPPLTSLIGDLFVIHQQQELNLPCWLRLLPDENKKQFCELRFDRPPQIHQLEIYTDGSYSQKEQSLSCTWGFVVLASSENVYHLIGHGYGHVDADPMANGWTGARSLGARQAELEAQIHAFEWLIQQSLDVDTHVVFDCLGVGMMAQGYWKINSDELQAVLLRNLVCAYTAFMHPSRLCEWSHVKSHTGCFGNELADSLATYAAQSGTECGGFCHIEYLPYLIGNPPAINWLWFALTVPGEQNSLPEIDDSAFVFAKPIDVLSPADKMPSMFLDRLKPPTSYKERKLELQLATYNVGTLRQKGKYSVGLFAKYLREQVAAHQIHILFLQETRANTTSLLHSDTHVRLVSSSHQGHGGSEIWLLCRDPRNQKILCTPRDVVVLAAEPELLVAKVHYYGLRLLLISAHGPHSGHSTDSISAFWKRLDDIVSQYHDGTLIPVLGIDANAHFAWEKLPHIGSKGLEPAQNPAADFLGDLLVKHDLFLPATFADLHPGESWTWRHSANQSKARCDYLVLPLLWSAQVQSSWISNTLDSGGLDYDHVPVHVHITLKYSTEVSQQRGQQVDRLALTNAPREKLQKIFADIEIPPWQFGVDEHFLALSNAIGQRLKQHFPAPKFKPRKSYISTSTWDLRLKRIRMSHELGRLKQKSATISASWAFYLWRYTFGWSLTECMKQGLLLFFRTKLLQHNLHLTTKELHRSLRQERINFLEETAGNAEKMPSRDFYRSLRQIGVAGKRYQRSLRPLPTLHASDGTVLSSREAIGERWREYFALQESGEVTTLDALSRCHDKHAMESCVLPTWTELPTLLELEMQMRKCQSLRAIFDDGIPGELFHKLPQDMAQLFYSLLLKMAVMQQEPLVCKGGLLVPAYKGKGSPKECATHRSLFVSSTFGKVVHGLYRQVLVRHLDQYGLPMQIGGRPGKATTQATQTLLAANAYAKKHKLNAAYIFLDVQNAFYKVLREHLVAHPSGDGFRSLFATLRLPADTYDDFLGLLELEPALVAAGASKHLQTMIHQFLSCTWFVVADCPTITKTTKGTRPGDSLADIAFSFVLAKVLKVFFATHFRDEGPSLLWNGRHEPWSEEAGDIPVGPICPIWADDVAIAILHQDVETLIDIVRSVSLHLFELLAMTGMDPNLKPSKTEVLLALRGKGSQVQLRNIMQDGCVFRLASTFGFEPLRIVGAYKHLGTWLSSGASLLLEIRTKIAMAHTVITKYRTQIFACGRLSILRKVQLFRSLVMSIVLYNVGAWHVLTKREFACFSRGVYGLYHRVARLHFRKPDMHWTHARVCHEMDLDSPIALLRSTRLRYLQHLVTSGQPQLWGLLQQDRSWWDQMYEDLDWLFGLLPWSRYCVDFRTDWHSLHCLLERPGASWKGTVKKGLLLHRKYTTLHYEWDRWHEHIVQRILACSLLPAGKIVATDSTHFCPVCCRQFPTEAAWGVHAFKLHNRCTPARLVAEGTQCMICLRQYESYVSLVHHLRYSSACFAQLAALPYRPETTPGLNSRSEIRSRRELRCPYLQAAGPQRVPRVTDEEVLEPEMERLYDLWSTEWRRCVGATRSAKLEGLRGAAGTSYLTGDLLRFAMNAWLHRCLCEESTTLDILEVVHDFQFRCTASWFFTTRSTTTTCAWEDLLHQWSVGSARVHPKIPRSLAYRPVTIAHLFSGHRRANDIQAIAETWNGSLNGVRALSVDIIFSVDQGDLTKPAIQSFFCRATREKIIHGIVAGPPCESWSVARTSDQEGPRPLRDLNALRGTQGLYLRELTQVLVGNGLLGASFVLFLEALLSGCFMLIEHPEEPVHKPSAASIWRLQIVRVFRRFGNCALLHIHQGFYGAASPKPTAFLVANGSADAVEILEAYKIREFLPAGRAIGKDSCGTWRTASLKAYPPALCRAIVALLSASIPCLEWDEHATQPAWFTEAVESMYATYDFDAQMGPDFAG